MLFADKISHIYIIRSKIKKIRCMKKLQNLMVSIVTYSILLSFPGYLDIAAQKSNPEQTAQSAGNIYLYGERHSVEEILKKEIEIWGDYYNKQGLRHLFLELPCYTAELLNIWMDSETEEILDRVYEEWNGTANHSPVVRDFFKEIKNRYPETVFHGTDVGHQYQTTGKYYLDYLSQQNKENSEQYYHAKEVMEQGKYYYNHKRNGVYREIMMVANFIREFNRLNNESIMGIYGSAHTGINSMDQSNSVPSMANQLQKIYTNQLFTENLSYLAKDIDPLRTDSIQINGSDYNALYFGRQSMKGFKDYEYREFWRIEGAYDDYKKAPKTGDVLPYTNYPMNISPGQVFIIDYMKTDSTLTRKYYRSDGNSWKNRPTTEEFIVD